MLMLVIYSFNSSKLVTVWADGRRAGMASSSGYYRHDERSDSSLTLRLRGDDGGGARYYRRGGDGAIWTIFAAQTVLRLCDHRAAGDAG